MNHLLIFLWNLKVNIHKLAYYKQLSIKALGTDFTNAQTHVISVNRYLALTDKNVCIVGSSSCLT